MSPRVYLVGAGPGDPGLLTLRAARCLAVADVVVHDYLLGPRLLEHVRPEAEVIAVGRSHDERLDQAAIGAILIGRVRAGKTVVRLKNGDPFLFGRGGEEAEALSRAGVPFEIVPGSDVRNVAGHRAGVLALAVSGDGKRLLSGSYDQTLQVWDLEVAESGRDLGKCDAQRLHVPSVPPPPRSPRSSWSSAA